MVVHWVSDSLALVSTLSLISCVTLGKSLHLSTVKQGYSVRMNWDSNIQQEPWGLMCDLWEKAKSLKEGTLLACSTSYQ